MKHSIKKLILILIVILLALSKIISIGAEKKNEEKIIITSFFPIYGFVKNLTVDIENITIKNMTQGETGCLHDYQLLPEDMKNLAQGKVFCVNGAGMEGFLDVVSAQFPNLVTIDASIGVDLLYDNEDENILTPNPHIWLDPQNAIIMVKNLAQGLIENFPDEAPFINTNLETYILKLEEIDSTVKKELSKLSNKKLITFHEAFTYFAKAYDLEVVAVMSKEPEEALTPSEIVQLLEIIENNPQVRLFVEPQYEDLTAQIISAHADLPLYQLDPLTTGEENISLNFYELGMYKNMETLVNVMD